MNVTLISTYELGRQPFGLASPAAWLRAAGAEIACLDLAVEPLRPEALADAGLVAVHLPMHTATRLAATLLPEIRRLAPAAHICCYGLYAPLNAAYLRALGAGSIIGGEFEGELVALYRRLSGEAGEQRLEHAERVEFRSPRSNLQPQSSTLNRSIATETICLDRLDFIPPDRRGLPTLAQYARVRLPSGALLAAGYTEASRGCKHRCRHCPIVPVYNGRFRVVPRAVVLEDVRRQVAAGAQHITFGDPDFFNGPGHALALVRALHSEFPQLTYDVTIKIEHLLRHAALLPELRATGCLFVTSAVEAVDEATLAALGKGHTRDDVIRAAKLLRATGLALNPTFVAFTPWTTPASYRDLLALIVELDLVENVAPVQYTIRLLVTAGSRLLELPEVRRLTGPFDPVALAYPWAHPDPRVDALHQAVLAAVQRGLSRGDGRAAIFGQVWALAHTAAGARPPALPPLSRAPIPAMTEPWYC
jgi:radical SAM superfamily enzyme YgiQ (UPF0313 family)